MRRFVLANIVPSRRRAGLNRGFETHVRSHGSFVGTDSELIGKGCCQAMVTTRRLSAAYQETKADFFTSIGELWGFLPK